MNTRLKSSLVAGCLAVGSLLDAHAAERVFACRNWVERDWPRKLLHYDIAAEAGEFTPGRTELLDGAGAPVAHQVEALERHADGSLKRGRVSFYADLPRGAAWTYTWRASDTPATFAPHVTSRSRGWLRTQAREVTNAAAGILVPPPGEHVFRRPVDPSEVPPPILGWRLADGRWVGKARLASDRLATGWSQRVIADGPLYQEFEYEVRFAPGEPPRDTPGYYRVRVRVEAEQPLVFVAEEYDFGSITAGQDFLILTLDDGWQPNTAVWAAYRQAPSQPEQVRGPRGGEADTPVWQAPLEPAKPRELARLFPHNDFGLQAQWYAIFADDGAADSPQVGIVTQHSGAWRLPSQSQSSLVVAEDGRIEARLRISMNLSGMPSNPFNTAEIDPDLPQTLGRRLWALVLGPRPSAKEDGGLEVAALDGWRIDPGFITLDDYKGWTLEWEEDASLARPRVFTTPAHLTRLKAELERCPGKEAIKDYSLISGDAAAARAEGERALQRLVGQHGVLNWHMTHYRATQNAYEPAFLADSALASPELPDDLRRRLRANLALFCHLWTHANFIPRGAGMHMGNPNMPINRFMGLPLFAALIPDHPQAAEWLDESYNYLKWKVSFNIASGGGMFRETLPYATYGPSIFFTTAAVALRNAGYEEIAAFEPLKEFGRYLNAVDTPVTPVRGRPADRLAGLNDRRVRVLPGLMRGSDVAGGQSRMMLASLTATSDPAYAGEMMGAFYEAGGFLGTEMTQPFMWFYWNPDIAPVTPPRRESIIAGLGGILRAHVGTPDEAYFALRMGYSQQRGTDQGSIAFYARGACLVPPSGLSAGHSQEGVWPHSVVAFGEPPAGHEHGRVDTNIEDYGFTPSVGYLLGRQTFKGRGPQLRRIEKEFESLPDAFDIIWSRQFQELESNFIYSRQTLLLRSPSPAGPTYAVLRDSTQGPCPLPSRWHLWLTTKSDNVQRLPGGVRAAYGDGVNLDIIVIEPAEAEVAVTPVTPIRGYGEDYSQLRIPQTPGKGYLTVLYPTRQGEPGPRRVDRLAEGIVRLETAESTDYVFCAVDQPVVYRDDTVDIAAFAGAVRIFPNRVLLVNAAGQHGSVGYRGVVAQGVGPFEHAVPVAPAKAETVAAGRTLAPVAPPAGTGPLIEIDGAGTHANPDVSGQGLKGWIRIDGDPASPDFAATSTVTYAMAEGFGRVGYRGFYVQGEAPFTLIHAPGKLTLTSEGRRRIFQMPIPENIVPTHLLPPEETLAAEYRHRRDIGGFSNWPWSVDVKVNGVTMKNGWYDGVMAIGLDDGQQQAVITPYTNPPVWRTSPWTRQLGVDHRP